MHLMLTLLLFMVEVKDEVAAMFITFTGGVEKLRIELTSAKFR